MGSGVIDVGYLGFGVSDLAAWKKFATEVLGLEYVPGPNEKAFYLRMDYQLYRFIITESATDDLTVLGLRVANGESLRWVQQSLTDAGIPFEVASRDEAVDRHVLEFIKLTDPAGIPVEVYHGPQMDYSRPFHPGRAMHGKFVTGEAGLGHCFIAGDNEKSGEFYRALGLRGGIEYRTPMLDGSHLEVAFYHGKERQHSVAFGVPTPKRINHFMIQAAELNDLGIVHDIVAQQNIPVMETLGKHANDQAFSFYFMTPSNFGVEYAWGGRPAFEVTEMFEHDIYGHLNDVALEHAQQEQSGQPDEQS